MPLARAQLESLLRTRHLDVTLAHVRPPAAAQPPLSTGRADLDAALGGGLPRGEVSEVAGPRSSGRTTLMCAALAATTGAGEPAALVDALDRFDVASAADAGVRLSRVLWIRGAATSVEAMRGAGAGHDGLGRACERALKAFALVLESRAFALAICDVADVPAPVLRRLPFTTWFRLARLVAASPTAAVLVTPERLGRSAGGVTVLLSGDASTALDWTGASDRSRFLRGVVPRARVAGRVPGDALAEGAS